MLKPTRMEFPRFSDEGPVNWVFHAEQYLECHRIRVADVAVYLEDTGVLVDGGIPREANMKTIGVCHILMFWSSYLD